MKIEIGRFQLDIESAKNEVMQLVSRHDQHYAVGRPLVVHEIHNGVVMPSSLRAYITFRLNTKTHDFVVTFAENKETRP